MYITIHCVVHFFFTIKPTSALISPGPARKLSTNLYIYRGADKSLARPGRKQATATEDFDVHIAYLLS